MFTWTKVVFQLMTSHGQIYEVLKNKNLLSHTLLTAGQPNLLFPNTGPRKLLNHSECLFSFSFSFHKMTPNGTVSHEFDSVVKFLPVVRKIDDKYKLKTSKH